MSLQNDPSTDCHVCSTMSSHWLAPYGFTKGQYKAFCGLQVIRAHDKRPNRKLFSAWLQSAYIDVPSVELKRADLDKVTFCCWRNQSDL